MNCHGCGTSRDVAGNERIGFRETCERCDLDLHVCLNCEFHDPTAYNECRETNAERVADTERSNRCDYFRPGGGAGGSATATEGNPLDSLFKKS